VWFQGSRRYGKIDREWDSRLGVGRQTNGGSYRVEEEMELHDGEEEGAYFCQAQNPALTAAMQFK
jgi:hypothetical protein